MKHCRRSRQRKVTPYHIRARVAVEMKELERKPRVAFYVPSSGAPVELRSKRPFFFFF